MAFVTIRDGNKEIYTAQMDGVNPVNVTNDPSADMHPSWSPDGERILFQSNRGGNVDIYHTDANGSDLVRVTHHQATDTEPSWSPDGSKSRLRQTVMGTSRYMSVILVGLTR